MRDTICKKARTSKCYYSKEIAKNIKRVDSPYEIYSYIDPNNTFDLSMGDDESLDTSFILDSSPRLACFERFLSLNPKILSDWKRMVKRANFFANRENHGDNACKCINNKLLSEYDDKEERENIIRDYLTFKFLFKNFNIQRNLSEEFSEAFHSGSDRIETPIDMFFTLNIGNLIPSGTIPPNKGIDVSIIVNNEDFIDEYLGKVRDVNSKLADSLTAIQLLIKRLVVKTPDGKPIVMSENIIGMDPAKKLRAIRNIKLFSLMFKEIKRRTDGGVKDLNYKVVVDIAPQTLPASSQPVLEIKNPISLPVKPTVIEIRTQPKLRSSKVTRTILTKMPEIRQPAKIIEPKPKQQLSHADDEKLRKIGKSTPYVVGAVATVATVAIMGAKGILVGGSLLGGGLIGAFVLGLGAYKLYRIWSKK